MATMVTASSLAKETGGSSTTGADRACSNERSRKDKYEDSTPKLAGRVCTLKSICNGCRQRKKLL